MINVYAFHKSGSSFLHRYFLKSGESFELFRHLPKEEGFPEHGPVMIHYRDPIDCLVSAFYSFGYTHDPPPPEETAKVERFHRIRRQIQEGGIDSFCKQSAIDRLAEFEGLDHAVGYYKELMMFHISSYSEMFNDFKTWNRKVCDFCDFDEERQFEAFHSEFSFDPIDNQAIMAGTVSSHKRNGGDGQYFEELKPETLDHIRTTFKNLKHIL